MCNTALMDVVKTIHELLEVISRNFIRERSTFRNEVEKLSSFSDIKGDIIDRLRSLRFLVDCLTTFNVINDVFMVKFNHDFDLI